MNELDKETSHRHLRSSLIESLANISNMQWQELCSELDVDIDSLIPGNHYAKSDKKWIKPFLAKLSGDKQDVLIKHLVHKGLLKDFRYERYSPRVASFSLFLFGNLTGMIGNIITGDNGFNPTDSAIYAMLSIIALLVMAGILNWFIGNRYQRIINAKNYIITNY